MEFLRIENLRKVYGKGENQVTALDGVSLTIEKGEFAAIIGSSGSGKSTLLHAIAGVDAPTSGKVYLIGQDVYAQNSEKLAIFRRRQVGLIYQFHNLIPTLNVVENMTLPILMDRQRVNRKRLEELLELLGLQERRDHLPSQLSGGQQQRVAIERAPGDAGRRAHRQPGQPQRRRDSPPAEGQPQSVRPDPDHRHPR